MNDDKSMNKKKDEEKKVEGVRTPGRFEEMERNIIMNELHKHDVEIKEHNNVKHYVVNNFVPPHCMEKIREMMFTESKQSCKVPFEVTSYERVMDLWDHYKVKKELDSVLSVQGYGDYAITMLNNYFAYHMDGGDHVILFSCYKLEKFLLLSKVGNMHVHIIIDIPEYHEVEAFKTSNIIACFS